MASLTTRLRREMVLSMVRQYMTCPYTGDVLDAKTCAVLVDKDGDPDRVFSPEAADKIEKDANVIAELRSLGYEIRHKGRYAFND